VATDGDRNKKIMSLYLADRASFINSFYFFSNLIHLYFPIITQSSHNSRHVITTYLTRYSV